VLEDLKHSDDVGVHELRGGAGFLEKPPVETRSFQVLLEGPFQGNLALELEVPRSVDDPHTATPDLLDDLEVPDTQRQPVLMEGRVPLISRCR
jgi:hypothetical protein